MAANIGECMEEHGVNFIGECVPIRRQKVEDGSLGKLKVTAAPSTITAPSSTQSSSPSAIRHLAGGCGRGAQPQEREAAAQRAGAVRRGQHLCHRRHAGHHGLCLVVHHGTGGQLKAAVTSY